MKSVAEVLPVYGVEHDAILSKMGDITIGFQVELPEIFTLSTQDFEAFHQAWVKAIKVLPVHSILHKQDWFVEAAFRSDFSGEQSFCQGVVNDSLLSDLI